MKLIILLFILLCINNVSANSTDIITPYHGYEGNLLITNEGTLIYNIFSFDGDYVGTIKPSESIYINNSYDYCIYGNYDEFRDLTDVNKIKSKFNQWWLIIFIAAIGIITLIICLKRIYK